MLGEGEERGWASGYQGQAMPGEWAAMPPTSILCPGPDGKNNQPDQGPACLHLLHHPAGSPVLHHLWAAAVWGRRHWEGGARVALEAGVYHSSPPPRLVMRLLQTGVALPAGPVEPSPRHPCWESWEKGRSPMSKRGCCPENPSPEKQSSLATSAQDFFLF